MHRFEKAGAMPRLQILRLPNDHTAGTKVGSLTPTALVADNDLGLGRVVEAVSKSTFWNETAIFVIEDDAQGGVDHVDAHRSPVLVISPYVKSGFVSHRHCSMASGQKTIYELLGVVLLDLEDALAAAVSDRFTDPP